MKREFLSFALILFLGVGVAAPAQAEVSFQAPVNHGVGTHPQSVATADFNGDGFPDLVAANQGSNNVSILLGTGVGFVPAGTYGVGSTPSAVTVGDFNRDGNLDLAVTNIGDSNVSILLGNGNGTFLAAVNYGAGYIPFSITTEDFNRDGKLDLAVTNAGNNKVSILLGNGNGSFQTAVDYAAGTYPCSVTTGDFNKDGKIDLAVTNKDSNNVSIFLGNGDGTFPAAVDYLVGVAPWSVATSDFDGDGKPDLAVANGNSFSVSILKGIGDGTFQPAVNYHIAGTARSVTVSDYDGDGKLDLALANYTSSVFILRGNGDGTFQTDVNFFAGSAPVSILTGDFNRDGKPDLAVVNSNGNNVSILGNITVFSNAGGFSSAVNFGAGTYPMSVAAGDFNDDGKLDLAVADYSAGVYILPGGGDGNFQASVYYGTGAAAYCVITADFNRDGNLDLAVSNANSNNVSILLGNGNGTFQFPVNYGVGSYPYSITSGDFNRDGILDLAVADRGSNDVAILRGNGDGTFQTGTYYAVGNTPYALTTGDFNGDGKLDLATANAGGWNATILLGNGDGWFSYGSSVYFGYSATGITTGDFNVDGKMDLAVAHYNDSKVSVILGNGNGSFQSPVFYGTGTYPYSLTAGDLDRDGNLDLAVINTGSNSVSVLHGNGNGTFAGAANYGVGGNPLAVVSADFNRDGKLDLAVANNLSNSVSILLNSESYLITASAGPNGTISPSGILLVVPGGNQSFTMMPSAGCHVTDVVVDGISVGALTGYEFTNMTANHTITASFAVNTYTITVTAGSNGSITPSGTIIVNDGNNQNFMITPNTGYRVANVLVDGSPVGAVTSYTFNYVTGNHTIEASFELPRAISGRITRSGADLSGVTVHLTGTATASATTDGSGDYTFTGLVSGSYTVTPALTGYTFSPPYRSVSLSGGDMSGQDFTATHLSLSFGTATNFDTGTNPTSVTTGDFNSDGKLDLAVASDGSNNVSILLGDGSGSFSSAAGSPYAVGSNPRYIATGDFNGDGIPDLVVANLLSNNVSILLGKVNRNGTFQGAVNYPVGTHPNSIAVGDFNYDGKLDLAVSNGDSNDVSIMLGRGDGTFQAAVSYPAGFQARSVIMGDFNGDGKLDLAVLRYMDSLVSILLGNGDGTFQAPSGYFAGSYPYYVAAGDFNRDGKLDLAIANAGGNTVSILLNNSSGGFSYTYSYSVIPSSYSRAIIPGDFNGDGKLDLAVACNLGSINISILQGNGNGTFESAVNYGAGASPEFITAGDFNNDGRLDLAVANYFGSNVSVLLNSSAFDPAGAFAPPVNYGAGGFPRSVTAADFNGDGRLDMAVVNYLDITVSILLGDGAGVFAQAGNYGMMGYPNYVTTGDFNGDGRLDLAVVGAYRPGVYYVGYVSVLLGNGDGTFQTPVSYTGGSSAWSNAFSVAIGDYDRDGKLDLAVASLLDSYLSVLLGNGDGTFQTPVNYWAGGSYSYSVITRDFNRDGRLDLVVANLNSANISVLLGNGNGTFQPAVSYGVESDPYFVTTGDLNGDGKLDLAVVNYGSNSVSILLGNGNGTFQATVNYGAGSYPTSVALGDLNRDGKWDLAVANGGSNNISIRIGNGDGTFQPTVNYGVGSYPYSVTAGDFNGDGKLDLTVANQSSNNVSLLTNTTTYSIAATAGTNGSISPSGAVLVAQDGSQSFTITPSANYHIADVSVDGVSVGAVTSYSFNNVTANHTISASFAINTHTITATAGAHGSIAPSGAVIVNHGSAQSFTIAPDIGYHVADVLVDGPSVGPVTGYNFTNLTANHTISANFALDTYLLTVNKTGTGDGVVTSDPGGISCGPNCSFAYSTGTPVTLSALPDSTSIFGNWSGACSGTALCAVTMDTAKTVTANFSRLTITATAGANGTISPSGVVQIVRGNNQSFTITPNTGYHVGDVVVDGSSVGAVTSYNFTNVTSGHTISASFAVNTYTITATTGVNGSITPPGSVTVNHGSNQSFTIEGNPGYHAADVLADGSSVGAVSSYDFTNVTANHTLSASFAVSTWTELSLSGGPPLARGFHSAVFDPEMNRMILFGGKTSNACSGVTPLLNDLWVLENPDGTSGPPNWIQLASSGTPPSGRGYHSAVYDAVHDRMILFGGDPSIGDCGGRGNDVWVLTDATGSEGTSTWNQLNPVGPPPSGRGLHSAVYDPATNRMIVFGGEQACGSPLSDVWVLDNANGEGGSPAWTQLSPAGTPPAGRGSHSAAYDIAANRMIVFGGATASGAINDVWVLENANGSGGTPAWIQLGPTGAPPSGRWSHTSVYDLTTNRIVIFGGSTDSGLVNDLWVLGNANGLGGTPRWIQLSPTGVLPEERDSHSAIYNPMSNRITVFAGKDSTCYFRNDAWVAALYTITATAGSGGTVSPSGTFTVVPGGYQSFSITPSTGYHVMDVLVDGASAGPVSSREFANVTGNHTISASFASDTRTVTATAGPNGRITPSGEVTVNYGSSQFFTITPDTGYHVADVLVDGVSQGAITGYQFSNVTDNQTISASFAINTYTVTPSAGIGGTINPNAPQIVNHHLTTSFEVTPNAGYHIGSVTGCGGGLSGSTYTTGAIISDCTVTATFEIDTYTITATAGPNGSFTPFGEVTVTHGSNQPFSIAPSTGYHVADVLVDGVSQGPISSYQFNHVMANHTISASFTTNTYTLTVNKTGTGKGSVTSNPAGINCGADCLESFNYGVVVTLTATPIPGYVFAGWTGDPDCLDGQIIVDLNKTCTATFGYPAKGLYADVPFTHWAYDMIMAISDAGITGGCSTDPLRFCPEDSVTRAMMAVFILTSLGEPPADTCTGMFEDAENLAVGDVFCRFIEKFASLGITGGCGGGDYCPYASVTRGQMAVFIEAAIGASPATHCAGIFDDVNAAATGDLFCRFIEDFASQGITGGCAGGNFCPDDPVTRAQMGVFLVAAPPPLNP